jgi:hypothetical protein
MTVSIMTCQIVLFMPFVCAFCCGKLFVREVYPFCLYVMVTDVFGRDVSPVCFETQGY